MKIKYGFIKLVSDIVKKDESQSKQWENATKNSNTKLTETLINVCYQIIYSQIN
jgi:hypothetical protein